MKVIEVQPPSVVQQSDNQIELTTVEPGPNIGANNQNEVWNRPFRNRGTISLNVCYPKFPFICDLQDRHLYLT